MSPESEIAVKKRSLETRKVSSERPSAVTWAWICLSCDIDLHRSRREVREWREAVKEDGGSI